MTIKIAGGGPAGTNNPVPNSDPLDTKSFEQAVAKTLAISPTDRVDAAVLVGPLAKPDSVPGTPSVGSRLDQLFGELDGEKGSVVVIDQRGNGAVGVGQLSGEAVSEAMPMILAGLTMAAKSADGGKILVVSNNLAETDDIVTDQNVMSVTTLNLKADDLNTVVDRNTFSETIAELAGSTSDGSELLELDQGDTLLFISSGEERTILDITQIGAGGTLDPDHPVTVRIVVADLKSSNSDELSVLVIQSGEAFRYNLFNFLSAAFGIGEDKSLPPGQDFTTANILGFQGFRVDETAAINPSNTYLAGVLTANAATYIGSIIPPDISQSLRAAGASEDFISGYMTERERVIDWAKSVTGWNDNSGGLQAAGQELSGDEGKSDITASSISQQQVGSTLLRLSDDPDFRRILDKYYVGYEAILGVFIYNMLVVSLNPANRR